MKQSYARIGRIRRKPPSRLPTESERKLADIVVQIACVSAEHMHGRSTEDVALWAAGQMRQCGFENKPVGSMWAYLTRVRLD